MNFQVDLDSGEKETKLVSEATWEMEKETIIFFDKLGFGWVLDNVMVKEMRLNHFKEECTYNKSLIKILENLLENPGV